MQFALTAESTHSYNKKKKKKLLLINKKIYFDHFEVNLGTNISHEQLIVSKIAWRINGNGPIEKVGPLNLVQREQKEKPQ